MHTHPIMIVKFISRYMFILLLPLLRGLLNYGRSGVVSQTVILEAVLAAAIIAMAVLRWRFFRVIIEKERITVKSGLLVNRCAVIPAGKISCIYTEHNLLLAPVRAAAVRIDTESGYPNKSDFEFYLSYRSAERLSDCYDICSDADEVYRAPLNKTVLMALGSASATTGLLVLAPVINRAGEIVGDRLNRQLMQTIDYAVAITQKLIPPAAYILALIMVAGFCVSFLMTLIKNIPFKIKKGSNRLTLEYGFIGRSRTLIPYRSIGAVVIKQWPFMRMMRHYCLTVITAGYGKYSGESSTLIPAATKKRLHDIAASLGLELSDPPITLRPPKRIFSRVIFMPVVIMCCIAAAAVVLSMLFPSFASMIVLLAVFSELTAAYYLSIRLYSYRFGGVNIGERPRAFGISLLNLVDARFSGRKTCAIRISDGVFDRMYSVCSVRISLRAENAFSLQVRNIDFEQANRQIMEIYGV